MTEQASVCDVRHREALEAIAAMRKNWQTFTSEWPFCVIDAFWECVAIAETALEEEKAAGGRGRQSC